MRWYVILMTLGLNDQPVEDGVSRLPPSLNSPDVFPEPSRPSRHTVNVLRSFEGYMNVLRSFEGYIIWAQ